jgi:hypothetical protein
MRRRRTGAAACVAVVGVVLSLAPIGAASASAKVNPHSRACKAIAREQAGATAAGFAIEKALGSGNFGAAKRQMLQAYDTDLANVTQALAVIKTAPPKVRAAFNNLRTYVRRIRADIKRAKTVSQIESELQTLGRDTQLQADGTTIASWVASVCGTAVPSTPTRG